MALNEDLVDFLKDNKDLLINNDIYGVFMAQVSRYPNGPFVIGQDLLCFLVNSGISLDEILSSMKYIPDYSFCFYNHHALPETSELKNNVLDLSPYPIEKILYKAFECCKVEEIIFPKTLKFIGIQAFYECNDLKEIILPEGLEVIGDEAFYDCYRVINVYIPDSCTDIGDDAFRRCDSIKDVSIPKSWANDVDRIFPHGCNFEFR